MENGPGLKMYFLLKMGIFQPAMLVYQRVVLIKVGNQGVSWCHDMLNDGDDHDGEGFVRIKD